MKETAKVLVVDDDRIVGQSFDRVLTQKGYEVSTALSGQEALDKLGSNGYDLVFTDIKMPGMDGIEVAKRVKEMNPWLPVVVVTGYGSAENEARAEEVGVQGFLHKPLSPEVIEWITQKTLSEKEEAVAEAQPRGSSWRRSRLRRCRRRRTSPRTSRSSLPHLSSAWPISSPSPSSASPCWPGVGFRTLTAGRGAK